MDLGAKLPFDQSKSDFSGISDENRFAISKVIHKSYLEVDEDGTIAAAATAIIGVTCCFIQTPPIDFKINRPFIAIIHDTVHNGILFIGKIMNP